MATKPANVPGRGTEMGGTFLAWGWPNEPDRSLSGFGSYGRNVAMHWSYASSYSDPEARKYYWSSANLKNANAIPAVLDSAWLAGWILTEKMPPPECDAVPTMVPSDTTKNSFCINRHDGCVNGIFLDWSVRKVGLKELWPLKWYPAYDTRGPWTRAGNVKPEDWPEWMRGFKDY